MGSHDFAERTSMTAVRKTSANFYDLDHEWPKLLNDLNTRCQQPRVPFMVEDKPADYVPRPREFEALIAKLLDQRREEPVAITAALRGAGGYGKTTMARALCHDERVQQAFDDGILWVTLGENPGNLVGKVEDLIYMLSHERPGFTGIDAAGARLTAFDAENAQARDAAVSVTLHVSFELLHAEHYARYQELAVFPEDVDIPLATLEKLWGATGGLDDFDTEELCQTLYRHSLLLNFDLATRTVRLHDVIRGYLQKAVGAALPALHAHLLDAYALKRWADLPGDEPYLWDHLAGHLLAAGRVEELVATVKD